MHSLCKSYLKKLIYKSTFITSIKCLCYNYFQKYIFVAQLILYFQNRLYKVNSFFIYKLRPKIIFVRSIHSLCKGYLQKKLY